MGPAVLGRLAAIMLLVLSAAPARAASEGADLNHLVLTALNLAILVVVLVWAGRKPIRSFFTQRRVQIQDHLDSAANERDEAEARYTSWQRRLLELDSELDRLRGQARERAEAERDRILADASAAAERIRRDASAAIEQELRRARDELRREASDLAVELAADMLRGQVSQADRDRLLDEFIQKVEAPAGGRAGARG